VLKYLVNINKVFLKLENKNKIGVLEVLSSFAFFPRRYLFFPSSYI